MRIRINSLFYKIFILFVTIDAAFSATQFTDVFPNTIHYACLIVSITSALMVIVTKKYNKNYILICGFVCCCGLYSYYISGNTDLMYTMLAVILIYEVDLNNILNLVFITRITVMIFTIFSSFVGVLEVGHIAISSADKGYLLGYLHANGLAGTVGILIFLYIAINRDNLTTKKIMVSFFVGIVGGIITRARIELGLVIIGIFLIVITKRKKEKLIFYRICTTLFPIVFISNMLLIAMRTFGIMNKLVDKIDVVFNGRMLLAALNLRYYPVTFAGQKVDISIIAESNRYYALDNGYAYILIHYGIIGLFLFAAIFQMSMISCKRNKESVLGIIVFVFMIWSIYEGMMVTVGANFVLLFALSNMKLEKIGGRLNEQYS